MPSLNNRAGQDSFDIFGKFCLELRFVPLQVLRENREALLTCVESFLHDPLVEWSGRQQGEDEVENPHAKDALETMEGRLNGTLLGARSVPSLALSYESHAHRLIEEATSHKNLGRMYIWWMPWL